MAQLEVKEGRVVEVTEVEVDVLALKSKIETLRNIAKTHNDAADELEAKLAAPEVKAVVDEKVAEVVAKAAALEAEKAAAVAVVEDTEPIK